MVPISKKSMVSLGSIYPPLPIGIPQQPKYGPQKLKRAWTAAPALIVRKFVGRFRSRGADRWPLPRLRQLEEEIATIFVNCGHVFAHAARLPDAS
jgi:hypothetical protein